ncbi:MULTISPECIES: aminotransferase class I/II-fold pyridoxal phosphate-dependent enzyme [Actinomyces]|uniref:Aminotransferase n=1 Tax=Actinomyces respiraculi TaxID=2744574 RepID=A0A7T0PX29_9ACTO|nr:MULTISPECIES: aminotransferase class I/II-fold pyridoxal phosphate-dependent enzyme [Actinomyces]QPL06369.1 aminotransferase class I/II-fold pyridoxal phosphate-dependent enzyme [Actinomyces respiraculi]
MKLARRAVTAQPFHAMTIGARAQALEASGGDVAKLSLGEPSFGAPPGVHEAMREVMDGRALPYTPAPGLPALREAIAHWYGQRHHVDLDPRRVIVTAGGSAALVLATALTVEEGDDVVMADPCYPCNRELVEAFGGRVVLAPSNPASRYQLSRPLMEAAWTPATTAVQMATPSNPTGTSIPFGELAEICASARERGAWRVVDEIYLGLADPDEDGRVARTVLETDPEALVVSSFSKFFSMTGWRLGWLVVPESLVEAAENLAVNFFLCAAAHTQRAALACFTPEALAACEERRVELVERRRLALEGLGRLGLKVPVEPDGAFYVYFDVSASGLSSWDFCVRALEEAHVALTPGRDFGAATADTHVRLSYAASRQEIALGLDRLAGFMASLR